MKRSAMVVGWLIVAVAGESQVNVIDSIRTEGHLLYQVEMAAWHGTGLFLKNHRELRENIGGYFSYPVYGRLKCVFFSKEAEPYVIGTITFDTTFNDAAAVTDTRKREFSQHERKLYNLKKLAAEEVDRDTLFAIYENTFFNFIPVADSFCRKVYITTSSEVKGIVLFGNDYLLRFDNKDSLISKKKLHSTMIPVDLFARDSDPQIDETFHVHSAEAGKYISATDICTLMLYRDAAKWKQHIVISRWNVCLWDMEQYQLKVLTREEWNKQNANKKQVSAAYSKDGM